MISCEIPKQKDPLEIVALKILLSSEWMSLVEFIFRKTGTDLNFAKGRLHLFPPLGIWKIFTAYISCTPAASYLYIMWCLGFAYEIQEFLVCIYFDGDTGRSLLSVCLIIFL